MFNVDGMSGTNREMTREALDIILKLWSANEPFDYKGKYWHVTKPDTMFGFLKPHIKPLQAPHPPIGVAGLSKGSDTLKLAGEKGYIPMSLNLNPAYVKSHWESVETGAAKSGRTPDRGQWRMVREVFVADTDEEAMRLSVGSHMGRMMREYFLPLLSQFGFFEYLKHDPADADSDVTPEYCASTTGSWARRGRSSRRSRRSTTRSAGSGSCWSSASTMSRTRRPGAIRSSFCRRRCCRKCSTSSRGCSDSRPSSTPDKGKAPAPKRRGLFCLRQAATGTALPVAEATLPCRCATRASSSLRRAASMPR